MANRRTALGALVSAGFACSASRAVTRAPAALIEGVVWQPSDGSSAPSGTWHLLGARTLLVQWSVVDGVAYLPGTRFRNARRMPDWAAIAREPWASEAILGLVGRFDGHAARDHARELGVQGAALARAYTAARQGGRGPGGLRLSGWYFPVEVEPTWVDVAKLRPVISQLPRPLWISAYDNGNIGPIEFAKWLAGWLPDDVGVFFQDGVGLHMREPYVAVQYDDAIAARLGRGRTRLIAEAFRPDGLNRFASAPPAELVAQLRAYKGRPVYLFEGPQYVSNATVAQIVELCAAAPRC